MKAKISGTRSYTIRDGDKLLAMISYPKRFSRQAIVSLEDGRKYEIKSSNFWGTKLEVRESGKTIISLKEQIYGDFLINVVRQGHRLSLVCRQKGFLKDRYVLTDRNRRELASTSKNVKNYIFRKLQEIEFSFSDSLMRHPDWILISALFVYLIRYYKTESEVILSTVISPS